MCHTGRFEVRSRVFQLGPVALGELELLESYDGEPDFLRGTFSIRRFDIEQRLKTG